MKNEKVRVYLYTCVSSLMQIDGYSLDAQKTKMKAFCNYNGYEIAETAEKVYIGSDYPDEFTHSKYTKAIRGANEKAKANVITAIGELIQISDKKAEFPDYGNRHGNKAKNG